MSGGRARVDETAVRLDLTRVPTSVSVHWIRWAAGSSVVMVLMGELARRVLSSVITRYAFLFVSAVLLPFSLRHPIMAAGVALILALVGYLLFTASRQARDDDRRDW